MVIVLTDVLTFAQFYYYDILYMLSALMSFIVLFTYIYYLICLLCNCKHRAAGYMEIINDVINDEGVNDDGDDDSD